MSVEALALLARPYDPRLARSFLNVPGHGTQALARGALELRRDAPVLVEHDPARVVGEVLELFILPWTDGAWHAARLRLDDGGWRSGTGISAGWHVLSEAVLDDGRRIVERAIVQEVSLTTQPAVPGAPAPLGEAQPLADDPPEAQRAHADDVPEEDRGDGQVGAAAQPGAPLGQVERAVEPPAVRRRQRRVPADRDERPHLALAGRLDLVGEGGDRDLAEAAGQTAHAAPAVTDAHAAADPRSDGIPVGL